MICFIDTETTGLDIDRHEVWEVALIFDDEGYEDRVWQLPVDLGHADPIALRVGRFHERRAPGLLTDLRDFAEDFADWTRDQHLCGANVAFDAYRLEKLLRANGALPEWHYHLLDVEAMALGFLHGRASTLTTPAGGLLRNRLRKQASVPFSGTELFKSLGLKVDDPQFEAHTALGDARLVKAAYELITGGE